MNNSEYIAFAAALLKRLHLDSVMIDEKNGYIPSSVDKGLRRMLFEKENYSTLLLNSLSEAKSNLIYRFFDEYNCNYMFFRLPDCSYKYMFVGPYLRSLPSEEFVQKKANQLSLSDSKVQQMREYYRSLPTIDDENVLVGIVSTLGSFIFGGDDKFDIEYVGYEIQDNRRPIYKSGVFDGIEAAEDNKLSLEIIEQNYQSERQLMDAVSKGKLNKVDIIASAVLNQGTEQRLSDSLRNRKNYLIIMNTLLRKAAEYGGVHPYQINKLSSHFAKRIEGLYSVDSSFELQREMIRKYCKLVNEYSLKGYSHLVGRVITVISYDLSQDLSLKSLASLMNANPSYLSAAFKRECGETLTDYVNRKRVEMAALILSQTDKQVQTVAEECGILDANYFIKIFKKHYGITPTQYRNSER